ncbi:MAG: response regulator [Thermodesulfobacteriota bacterium]|nr:MAG: response regulator [Thermodesulfobacteriota bacterium]
MPENKQKVLLVEDNYMNTVLVREILEMNGYEMVEAGTGAEAIRLIATEKPDLVLMDIHLPGMDGVTATRIIKSEERYRSIPVLALTASASKNDEEEILSKGFDGYVTKPINVKSLLEAMENFLKKGDL